MRRPTALFTFALALGVAFHAPGAGAQAPTQITACGTIAQPGSYVLANNLTAQGNCLVVNADFVTIDLAGFLITGTASGVGIITIERGIGTAVRNGTITGFSTFGVFLGFTGSIVEGVRVVGSTIGIRVSLSGIVRNNTSVDTGIIAGAGSTVTGNTVQSGRTFGINAGPGSTVTDNTVTGNPEGDTGTGIVVDLGSTVIGNTVRNFRGGDGISAGAGSTVTGNTVQGNGGAGIRITVPPEAEQQFVGSSTVTGNTVLANQGEGIIAGAGSTVTGNTVQGNGFGIFIPPDAEDLEAFGSGTLVAGNTVRRNNGVGISTGRGSTVSGNTISRNDPGRVGGPIGLQVGPGSTVSNNTADRNSINVACSGGVLIIHNTATPDPEGNFNLFGRGCALFQNVGRVLRPSGLE